MVFEGSMAYGPPGIYFFNGSSLKKVATTDTPIPNGVGNFTALVDPVISGSNVVFTGAGSTEQVGIYLFNGSTLSVVADTKTPIPGGIGNFESLYNPVISDGGIAFEGFGMDWGIYLFHGGTLRVIVDTNTPVPGGIGDFSTSFNPMISGNNIAFQGSGPSDFGIYCFDGRMLNVVVNTNTPIPNATGNFLTFLDPVISGNNIAFLGIGTEQVGIYMANQQVQAIAIPLISELGMVTLGILLGGSSIYLHRRRRAI